MEISINAKTNVPKEAKTIKQSKLVGGKKVLLKSASSEEKSGNYTYTVTDNVATITGYSGSASIIAIPKTIADYPVRKIGYTDQKVYI